MIKFKEKQTGFSKSSQIQRKTTNLTRWKAKIENLVLMHYVPGTAASIHGLSRPEGEWVVVSWVPLRWTSVDLAANHPESSTVFPISAIHLFKKNLKEKSTPDPRKSEGNSTLLK
jgi:hypothetical protein